jgi:hypothetical protein
VYPPLPAFSALSVHSSVFPFAVHERTMDHPTRYPELNAVLDALRREIAATIRDWGRAILESSRRSERSERVSGSIVLD